MPSVQDMLFLMLIIVASAAFVASGSIDSEDLQTFNFQGTISKKEIKTSYGLFGATDEDYFFLINTNNTSIVEEVSFETYLRYETGDSYDYTLNNLTDKKELRELGAIP